MTPYLAIIRRFWPAIPILALGVMFLMWRGAEREADRYEALAASERAAHAQTVTNYRLAAKAAQEAAQANVERVEAEQERITANVTESYRALVADARNRYRLLASTAAANSGSADATHLPSTGTTPSGTDGAAAHSGLPADAALIATEQALQLLALQEWVRQQAGVVTGKAQ